MGFWAFMLINAAFFGWTCFKSGKTKQKEKNLEALTTLYLKEIQSLHDAQMLLHEANKSIRLDQEEFVERGKRVKLEVEEILGSIRSLSVIAERLILSYNGVQIQTLNEEFSELLTPILGFAGLSEKVLKNGNKEKDASLTKIREWNFEILESSQRLRDFLGKLNQFNAPVIRSMLPSSNKAAIRVALPH